MKLEDNPGFLTSVTTSPLLNKHYLSSPSINGHLCPPNSLGSNISRSPESTAFPFPPPFFFSPLYHPPPLPQPGVSTPWYLPSPSTPSLTPLSLTTNKEKIQEEKSTSPEIDAGTDSPEKRRKQTIADQDFSKISPHSNRSTSSSSPFAGTLTGLNTTHDMNGADRISVGQPTDNPGYLTSVTTSPLLNKHYLSSQSINGHLCPPNSLGSNINRSPESTTFPFPPPFFFSPLYHPPPLPQPGVSTPWYLPSPTTPSLTPLCLTTNKEKIQEEKSTSPEIDVDTDSPEKRRKQSNTGQDFSKMSPHSNRSTLSSSPLASSLTGLNYNIPSFTVVGLRHPDGSETCALGNSNFTRLRQRVEQPIHEPSSTTILPPSFQQDVTSSNLQYPQYFKKGSMIKLADGKLRRVEDMMTKDFIESASLSSDLCFDSSTIIKIEETEKMKDFSISLTFSVGKQKSIYTVEAPIEHPFFIVEEGWSSYLPERSHLRYGLNCRQLKEGDVCISLTEKPSVKLGSKQSKVNNGTNRNTFVVPNRKKVKSTECQSPLASQSKVKSK